VLQIRDVLSPIPESDPTIFSSRIPDPNIFNPGSSIKNGMQTYFFLASYAFRSKVFVLVIVKKTRDPRSGRNSSRIRIPEPGGKKAPDPGSGTLTGMILNLYPELDRNDLTGFPFSILPSLFISVAACRECRASANSALSNPKQREH
jgi:hypothetical protein